MQLTSPTRAVDASTCRRQIGAAAVVVFAVVGSWSTATAQAPFGNGRPGAFDKPRPAALPALNARPTTGRPPGCVVPAVPAAPFCVTGVDATITGGCGEATWAARGPIPWQAFAQGEYVGHAREQHVPDYRLRVDDELDLVYRLTREEMAGPYELNLGDQVRVESFADDALTRDLVVQPDGTITLRLLGQVRAAGRTVPELRDEIERQYREYYREPAITVTPLQVNTKLEDLLATVDATQGFGGQFRTAKVTPEGSIQLPAIGSVPVHGFTLDEAGREINERYAAVVSGIEVTPVLKQRAPRYVYVLGEVAGPGRYTLESPTTVMQALALAGGWSEGANTRQVVVFRRGDDWRLMATMLDLRGALYGKRPGPSDEIWLNDADIVIVPKAPVLVWDEFIDLVFTRGIYGVLPFQGVSLNFSKLSSL